MNIQKKYLYTNGYTIWRLIPSGDRLLIEERDEKKKQVYFNCVEIESGKSILKNFQLDEKFWVGIEAFENNRIYFHKFAKPDMPGHMGITAYDLGAKKILWTREDLVFLFLYKDKVFTYLQKFESREIFSLDAESGNIIKEYGENALEINSIREELISKEYEKYKDYLFPENYVAGKQSSEVKSIVDNLKQKVIITGEIEFINYKKSLLLGFHTVRDDGKLNNNFRTIEIDSGKVIFEDVVNSGITSYIPDSFFIKNNLLFLIKHKTELVVFSLI